MPTVLVFALDLFRSSVVANLGLSWRRRLKVSRRKFRLVNLKRRQLVMRNAYLLTLLLSRILEFLFCKERKLPG